MRADMTRQRWGLLVACGITPLWSHLRKAAAGEADPERLRRGRRFGSDTWNDRVRRLQAQGLVDPGMRRTDAGRRLHEQVQAATDTAAAAPWPALGAAVTGRLADLVTHLAATAIDSGTLPVPNPIGLVLDRSAGDRAGSRS